MQVHAFARFDAFRKAADDALTNHSNLPGDIFGYEEAYRQIRAAIAPDIALNPAGMAMSDSGVEVLVELGLTGQEAVYANILLDTPLEPYFSVANTLRDALRNTSGCPPVAYQEPGWREAIRVAISFVENSPREFRSHATLNHKDTTFAFAVRWLNDQGISIPLVGDTVFPSADESHRLACVASRPLISLGDVDAMRAVEDLLVRQFDGTIKRLHLHPTPDMMGRKTQRSLPHGYMYRIALKALGKERTTLSRKTAIDKSVVGCINLGAIFNVEPFSSYETMFGPRPGKALELLREIVIYDELFTIPQSEPFFAGRVIKDLFGGIDVESVFGWSTDDAMTLFLALIDVTKDYVRSQFVKKATLLEKLSCRIGTRKAEGLIRSFAQSSVNSNYELPHHAGQAQTRECVLIHASKERYWVPAQLFIGPAFYNRMVTLYSQALRHTSTHLGKAFEFHVERRMQSRSISYLKGDYGGKNRAGDADLIIETEGTIALFELKKKALRRETFAGSDLQLAIDLSQGLVHGVNQLAKQELRLRKDGMITFVDGSTLEWKRRRILKIVLSAYDYGGLHETVVVQHALRGLCGSVLTTRMTLTETQTSSLEEANKELKKLGENLATFSETAAGDDQASDMFFENIRFLDIFLLERILGEVTNASDLVRILASMGQIVTGRRDPHFDFEQFKPVAIKDGRS